MRKKLPAIPEFVPPVLPDGQRGLWIMGKVAYLLFPFDREVNSAIQCLPGSKWIPEHHLWAVPLDTVEGIKGIIAIGRRSGQFTWQDESKQQMRNILESIRLQGFGVLLDHIETEQKGAV